MKVKSKQNNIHTEGYPIWKSSIKDRLGIDWEEFKEQYDTDVVRKSLKRPELLILSDKYIWVEHTVTRLLHQKGKGAYKDKGRYRAIIRIEGKNKSLGYYETEEEAMKVYELARLERIMCTLNDIRLYYGQEVVEQIIRELV